MAVKTVKIELRHQVNDRGDHRIVDRKLQILGDWAEYRQPAVLLIEDQTFVAYSSYYEGWAGIVPGMIYRLLKVKS